VTEPRTSREVHASPFLTVVVETWEDLGDYEVVRRPDAAAVLAVTPEGDALLVRQFRPAVRQVLTEVPAGLLDVEGEDFVVGAARELAEEADLVAAEWNVLVDFFNSPGSSSEAIRIYLARGLTDVPGHELHVRTDEEAEIELHWIPLENAVAAVLQGRLHNPSAVVGILAAAAARADDFARLRPGNAPWPAHPSQR
jgi:8-oxo-dGDP phosphatase